MRSLTDIEPASGTAPAHKLSRRPSTPRGGAGTSSEAGTDSKTKVLGAAARHMLSVLTSLMVLGAVAAFLFLAVGPRILGYQTSTMLTGSMAPIINPGDVVVTAPAPIGDISVGDIITYHIPVEDKRVETHRVTAVITNPDGTTAVRTKGDANHRADPWTATLQGSTVDKHAFTVPYVGQAIRFLRQPVVLNTLMYGAPAVLVTGLLASIWRKAPDSAAPSDLGRT